MIKYIIDGDNAGKILRWETLAISGVSAPILSGLARTMIPAIDRDIQAFKAKREEADTHGTVRYEDEYGKCDLNRIVVEAKGEYVCVSYCIRVNRFSAKDVENLKEIGFIDVVRK